MSQNDPKSEQTSLETPERELDGATIIVETLIRSGVRNVFGYPGGATIPLHQAFSRYRDQIRVILPRHEQACGFAAQGFARVTGEVGVCTTTSGPGATNIVTAIADAKLDSVPIVIITGQVPKRSIGEDSFQETPITEVCRCITKHHYLAERTSDLARIVREAIAVAKSGRPGPVLIDVPKDVMIGRCVPDFEQPFNLPGYDPDGYKGKIDRALIAAVAKRFVSAQRPMIVSGGGVTIADARDLLIRLSELTGTPVATTMPGLASFPRDHANCVGMAGMHGTYAANCAIRDCDVLLVLGARFSDRVAAVPKSFAKDAFVAHFDVDPSECNKVKEVGAFVLGDLKETLGALVDMIENERSLPDLTAWKKRVAKWEKERPVFYRRREVEEKEDMPIAQAAIADLSKATQGKDVIITTGVGQHQLWTTLFYHFNNPRSWLSSCGLGTMGFGLPSAMGAKIARPEAEVIAIEGDGSLQMNIQEMATCVTEHIPVKLLLVNNQHLGNVVQWEDMFFGHNRANTYLGDIDDPENIGKGDGFHVTKRYPDYVAIAKAYGWDAVAVEKYSDYPAALKKMLASKGPFMIDLRIPYSQYVLPMIPPGKTVDDICFE